MGAEERRGVEEGVEAGRGWAPSESAGHCRQTDARLLWRGARGQVPHEQGGVSPIEFARLSSVRDGVLTSSYLLPRISPGCIAEGRRDWEGMKRNPKIK